MGQPCFCDDVLSRSHSALLVCRGWSDILVAAASGGRILFVRQTPKSAPEFVSQGRLFGLSRFVSGGGVVQCVRHVGSGRPIRYSSGDLEGAELVAARKWNFAAS